MISFLVETFRLKAILPLALILPFNFLFAEERTHAEIRSHMGTPTLFINGVPNAALCYMMGGRFIPERFSQFGNIGVDLVSFNTDDLYSYCLTPKTQSTAPTYDYSAIDQQLNAIINANSKAYIIPRIFIGFTPHWWDSEYNDELVVFDDESQVPIMLKNQNLKVPSFSSDKWRNAAAENLENLIKHIRAQPYAKNIIGYHLAAGSTAEWLQWNFAHGPASDFSVSQLKAYRKWLKEKYKSKRKLRKAWNNRKITFKTASIPSMEERATGDYFIFRDPMKSKHIIDYMEFHSWIVQDAIKYVAKVAKEACNYESLVGFCYGYTLHVRGQYQRVFDSFQEQGHFALSELLESPNVDFLSSPTQYEYREVGSGYSVFMSLQSSIRLHGKLWIDENDYRTHLLPITAGYGRTRNYQESTSAQLRQLSNELTHATGAWWFDQTGEYYNSERVIKLIERLNVIGEKSINFDRRSSAEIAVVVDEYSNLMMRNDKRLSIPLLYYQMLPLGKIGAPFDYILQDDLSLARPYKLYIFLNAFHVTEKQKTMISRLPERGAKALLWVYAPGYVNHKTLDVKSCFYLTGMQLATLEGESQLQVIINSKGSDYLPGVEKDMTYGVQEGGARNLVGPVFYGDDPSAEVLGLLYGHDLPGLITKNIAGVQVYYSAAPQISSAVLRGIATNAGVHIYNINDDVLYANNSFIALHTATAGQRSLNFPQKTSLYDVYRDIEIAQDVRQIIVDLPVRESFLYFRGTKYQWENN